MQLAGFEMGTCGQICLIRSEDLPRDPIGQSHGSTASQTHSVECSLEFKERGESNDPRQCSDRPVEAMLAKGS